MPAATPKHALVLLAPGAEELETVAVVDVLRRARVHVTLAGVAGADVVECSRGVFVRPDCALSDVLAAASAAEAAVRAYDAVVVPGGAKGAETCASDHRVLALLRAADAEGKIVAALCAGPTALIAALGSGVRGRTMTAYPSFRDRVVAAGATYTEKEVAVDGRMVTSRGPGTAVAFALALVEQLVGGEVRRSVADGMLVH